MKAQKFILPVIYATLGGMLAIILSNHVLSSNNNEGVVTQKTPAQVVRAFAPDSSSTDFTWAAERSVDAVVHVTTEFTQSVDYSFRNPLFDFFWTTRLYAAPKGSELWLWSYFNPRWFHCYQ